MNPSDIGAFLSIPFTSALMAATAALGVKIGSGWIGAQALGYRTAFGLALRSIGLWSLVLGVVFHFARVRLDSGTIVNGTLIGLAVGLIQLAFHGTFFGTRCGQAVDGGEHVEVGFRNTDDQAVIGRIQFRIRLQCARLAA